MRRVKSGDTDSPARSYGDVDENKRMRTVSVNLQAKILSAMILANFLAQIPYFVHGHYTSQPLSISMRSALLMGSVSSFFLIGTFLLFKRHRAGYPLMLIFLSTEFLFYLWNLIGSTAHGYGLFFQMRNPDGVLRIVFAIGYVNLFAAGYFLFLLLHYRDSFRGAS